MGNSGTASSYGLNNSDESTAALYNGSFDARGGVEAYGIYNGGPGETNLSAYGISASGGGASNSNGGLKNVDDGGADLRRASFTAEGGTNAYGIMNTSATLNAEFVSCHAFLASDSNYGFFTQNGEDIDLNRGNFGGEGGDYAYGIYNSNSLSFLQAHSSKSLAFSGAIANYGLYNSNTVGILQYSTFIGHGGASAYGIYNTGSTGFVGAMSAEIRAENGTSFNYGIFNTGDAVAQIKHCLIEGPTNSVFLDSGYVWLSQTEITDPVSGSVSCSIVNRGSTVSTDGTTCP